MRDITHHLISGNTDHMELENFLAGLGPCQREPRNVTKGSITYYSPGIRALSNRKGNFTLFEWLGPEGEALDQFLSEAKVALSSNGRKVGSRIAFFKHPIDTTFRIGDHFQIVPVPASWARPEWQNAPHPALLEFSYSGSPNPDVDRFRSDRSRHAFAGFLSVALKSWMTTSPDNLSTWVVDAPGAASVSHCVKTGYLPGSEYWPHQDENGFSATGASQSPMVPTEQYYQEDQLFEAQFCVPQDITSLLDCFLALRPFDRASFLRAAHLYRSSQVVRDTSFSVATLCLFAAMEALMGPPPPALRCECCGKQKQPSAALRFREFLNDHKSLDSMENARELVEEYSKSRNGVAHGGKLATIDTAPYDGGFGEGQGKDRAIYRSARHVFLIASINWLQSRGAAGH